MFDSTIGHYTIIDELGRGGMAVVYRAHDPRFQRDVALKVLPREFMHDPTFKARFVREARAIAQLEHSAIVPVHDYGEHDGQPYLVMRYMSGGSLSERITRGPLSLEESSKIVDRISAALDAAHARAIIHRDIKPGNILFDDFGDAFLSDFGIVRLTEATAQLTGRGLIGTPAYMAPEMTQKGGLTSLIDVYALGVTLFEMLSGHQPYQADTPMGTALAHATNPIPDIRSIRPDLPENLQLVIEQALAKDPAERYQSAGELADVLRQTVVGVSGEIPSPVIEMASDFSIAMQPDVAGTLPEIDETLLEVEKSLAPPVPERRRVNPLLLVGGLIAAAVVVTGLLVFGAGGNRGEAPTAKAVAVVEASPTSQTTPTIEIASTVTPTEEPTSTIESPTKESDPNVQVAHNADWQPVIEEGMVLVPAGCDVHGNCFDPFWIDMYEVFNAEFTAFLNSEGNQVEGNETCLDTANADVRIHQIGDTWTADSDYENHPVIEVSWYGAQAFCAWRGAWLPDEWQWEYSARGPDGLKYPWGDDFIDKNVVYSENNCGKTCPVGSRPGGVSWVGAYDMSGNVWEWTSSLYDSRGFLTLRGGSWLFNADFVLAESRYWGFPTDTDYNVGFRCAYSYSP